MPRTPKSEPIRRLNLEMREATREKLESLRERTQADSLAEVIRRALAVYDFLWEEKSKGGRVIVQSKNSQREVVLI